MVSAFPEWWRSSESTDIPSDIGELVMSVSWSSVRSLSEDKLERSSSHSAEGAFEGCDAGCDAATGDDVTCLFGTGERRSRRCGGRRPRDGWTDTATGSDETTIVGK